MENNLLLLMSLARKILPVKEVEAGVNVLNRLPVVNEVAEMEATEPMVFDEVNSKEPEEREPGRVSTILNFPLGVLVPMPTLLANPPGLTHKVLDNEAGPANDNEPRPSRSLDKKRSDGVEIQFAWVVVDVPNLE